MQTFKPEFLKRSLIVMLAVSILGGLLYAQSSKVKGPRALGVLEITANGKARLIPVGILVNGQWYDAGLYMASPRPMALDSGVVYEGQNNGDAEGLFTIGAAREVGNQWIGLGKWKPQSPDSEEEGPKLTQKTVPVATASADDQPPILRRPSSEKTSSSPSSTTPSKPDTSGLPATLPPPQSEPTKPASAPQESKKTEPTPAAKPEKAAPETQQAKSDDEDPNRPILRRTRPGENPSVDADFGPTDTLVPAADTSTTGSQKTAAGKAKPAAPVFIRTLAAISDAHEQEPQSYVMQMTPAERDQYTQKLSQMAIDSIRKFAQTHRVGERGVPNVALDDVRTNVFDLNNSNEPVLVFTARAVEVPAPAQPKTKARSRAKSVPAKTQESAAAPAIPAPGTGLEYYVTIVGRVDMYNEMQKVYDEVTDSSHLDAYPRMQLISAVDANGDGVGELLFREVYDRSQSYIVYRVGIDKLWTLFEGARMSKIAGE